MSIDRSDILERNNVRVFGAGSRPMVFAHGFGCDQQMWRHVAPAFADDYRVVLFDYVGSGGSRASSYTASRYGSLRGYASDVLDVCAALDLEQAVFVGHSVSAMVGALAAIREPARFARLVMVSPSPCYQNHLPDYAGGFELSQLEELLESMDVDYAGWARYLAPVVVGNADRPELSEELAASFCKVDPWIARRFAEATFLSDNRADLPRVPVPSLILQTRADLIAPEAVGEYMHRQVPRSTLRRLAATGHAPHMSHPAEVIGAMQEYLSAA